MRKIKKCARSSAFSIKIFLTMCGLVGLGCMAYDMKYKRDCDLHYFTSYVSMLTSVAAILGFVAKFSYELYKNINCFYYEDTPVQSDLEDPIISDGDGYETVSINSN